MHKYFFGTVLSVVLLAAPALAQMAKKNVEILKGKDYRPIVLENSTDLATILKSAIDDVIASPRERELKSDELAATLIDLRDPKNIRWANYRGDEAIYPASVVKMFFMAGLHQQLQDGKVTLTPELQRGLRDMIVDSSNEATQYVLDVITDTSSGAELPQKEFEKWQYKRNRVNRYFSSMGYTGINVNQKTFCEDAYGIEQQSRNYKGQNRNMLTTNATARLLAEIVLGRAVNADRSRQMMELLRRDPFRTSGDPDSQATGFTGRALIDANMTSARLWSKAGWTSKARHDAAYVETPDGSKFVLVVFTENHAGDREPIPSIAAKVMRALSDKQ